MSGIKRYIAWCEDEGHTNEVGEVVSMEYADEYMKSREYAKQIKEQAFKEALSEADEDSLLGIMRKIQHLVAENEKIGFQLYDAKDI